MTGATDPAGGGARAVLSPLGFIYSAGASLRNHLYDRGILKTARLPRPVISVGNLTAGGTGKTPCTFWILERAKKVDKRVFVLTRGYGGGGGANDEVLMLQNRYPDVPVGIGADRLASAAELQINGVADAFLLDDGFQHRRVARDLDILLIDAREPLRGAACLPAGMLRESPRGIRRAGIVILTKIDGLARARLDGIWQQIERYGYRGPRVEALHRAVEISPIDFRRPPRPLRDLQNAKIHLLSSIARPDSFEQTVISLGGRVAGHRKFPDHYHYRPADLPDMRDREGGGEFWCVTEKDAPKLRRLGVIDGYILKIDFAIAAGEQHLESAVLAALTSRS